MEIPDKLKNSLDSAVEKFEEMEKIRLISHYDADGISAASIILASCLRSEKNVHLSIVEQIRPELIEKLKKEAPDNIIFTDLGSGHLSLINELSPENMIILDHHNIEGELENGCQVNPHLAGFEEGSISGAGVSYLFSKELSEKNKDLAPLAVVGAIGDIQEENWKMKSFNADILQEAEDGGLLERREGLRLFGRLSRPIHKTLQYTTRPWIPGVSENESGTIQFLSEIDIDPKDDNDDWKKLDDLTKDEKKELASAVIKARINEGIEEPQEVFGNVYTLKNFKGRFKDARELSTALNACGRMSQPHVGILACLGDSSAKEELKDVVKGYKRIIGKLLRKSRKGDLVNKKEDMTILEGIGKIPENFVGTICSILQPSVSADKIMMGFAESSDDELKISVRVPEELDKDVGEIIGKIAEKMGGEGGGHEKAGGAYIKEDKKEEFVKEFKEKIFNKTSE